MEEEGLIHSALTERIINCYYTVYNKLRYGFMEKIYENAMLIELKMRDSKLNLKKELRCFMRDLLLENTLRTLLWKTLSSLN